TSPALVLRLARIDLVDPFQDSAPEVLHVREADRLEEVLCFRAAAAHLALRDDLAIARQLLIASRQLAQRDQRRTGNAVDLILVRLAYVEDERRLTGIQLLLQIDRRDLPVVHDSPCGLRRLRLGPHAAELF